MSTYKPPPLSEVLSGATAHFPRVCLDIEVGLRLKVLDLVDPWLQFSVFEDGRGVAGRLHCYVRQGKYNNVENTRRSRCFYISYTDVHSPHFGHVGARWHNTV